MSVARAPYVRLVDVPGVGVAFRTPTRFLLVEGDDAPEVRRLWDLLETPQEIAGLKGAFGDDESAARTRVDELVEAGLLARQAPLRLERAVVAEKAPAASGRLGSAEVRGEDALRGAVAAALEGYGIEVGAAAPSIVVAVARSEDIAPLGAAADEARRRGLPVVSAEWRGLGAFLGPTHRPGTTACWRCADLRAWGNAASPEAFEADRGPALGGAPLPAAHAGIVAGLVAGEALRVLAGQAGAWEDAQLELDLWSGETRRAPVLRVPGCPSCGTSGVLA